MREIKFRAWDGKEMLRNQEAYFRDDEWWYGLNDYDTPLGAHSGNENNHLMQFTGLLDKNGVEIYEGDVVEHRNFIKELLGVYEVRWGVFGFTLFDKEHPEVKSYYVTPELLEVVGNIYE